MGFQQLPARGQSSLSGLVALPDPVLRMSRDGLRARAGAFLSGFPGRTAFAVKSNAHRDVLHHLARCGITTFDVASIREMEIVRAVLPQAVIHYHNPIRSTAETQLALLAFGCRRFAVDRVETLESLAALVAVLETIEVGIRFRSDEPSCAVQAFQSKFGATTGEAAKLMAAANARGFRAGLNFHPGSQTLEPDAYADHILLAGKISRDAGCVPAFVNVGGGFPGSYAGLPEPALPAYFQAISAAATRAFGGRAVPLECEPGRGLVAAAGTLETRVKAVHPETREVFLNDGIYGGLMEVYQFPSLRPVVEAVAQSPGNGQGVAWTVYGPTCDPVDVLPFKPQLPEALCEGDAIRFHGTGAYSTATATRFNGYGAIDVRVE